MRTLFNTLMAAATVTMFPFNGYGQEPYEVFVSSRGTNSVHIYNMNGDFISDFLTPALSGLNGTEDILFHPDGSILVTGFNNSTIKRFDGLTCDYLGDFSMGYGLTNPSKMSIGPDSLIYVTQWGTQDKVVRFDLQGNFVDEFTKIGAPKGLGHVWDEDGNFYISIFGTGGDGTVHRFDSLGNDLGTFINSDILQGPTGIWFDKNGDMLVEDWTVGKVLRYDSAGKYVSDFVTGMINPEGVDFFPDGSFLIGDWGKDAVHLFDSNGVSKGDFTIGHGLVDPNSVKVRKSLHVSVNEKNKGAFNFQVYPTTGSGPVNIKFELNSSEQVNIQLTDILGRNLQTIENNRLPGGTHQYEWVKNDNLQAGMYFIRLTAGSKLSTEKIIVR